MKEILGGGVLQYDSTEFLMYHIYCVIIPHNSLPIPEIYETQLDATQ